MKSAAGYSTGVVLLAWASLAMGATIHVPAGYTSIQGAIDASSPGDTVLVESGTYTENISFNALMISVQSVDGPDVTVINGNQNGSVVTFPPGTNSILEGFSIVNGNGAFFPPAGIRQGGGIWCDQSSPTIRNCRIVQNSAYAGGGIAMYFAPAVTIENCGIKNNESTYEGGGVYCYESSFTMSNSEVTGNSGSILYGGGVYLAYSNEGVCFTNCIIAGNFSVYGGGIYCWGASPTITNCTIADNAATSGGGICCYDGYPYPLSVKVVNSILWGNTPDQINLGTNPPDSVGIIYTDIAGGDGKEGNIDADPVFVEGYHLGVGSPCIDAGDNTAVTQPGDLDGNPRIQGAVVDMGAYETTGSPKDVLDKAIDIVIGLDPAGLTNPNSGNALVNKFEAAIALIEAGLYQEGLNKLKHDVLPKMDGCTLRSQPDKDDWIITCDAQQKVYPLVLQAIELLEGLI